MKLRPILSAALLVGATLTARATVVALWTFEVSKPAAANQAVYSGVAPEMGIGSASGVHSDLLSDWSSPAGNGSSYSFNGNRWGVGDYFQFQTALAGFKDVVLSWSQTRSGTGPGSFSLTWSTNGAVFTPFSSYSVGASTWSSGSEDAGSKRSADLSSVAALDNVPSAFFRLTAVTAAGGTAGSVRVDDFQISASPLITPVPEVSTVGAIGFAVIVLGSAWRRSRSQ